MQVQFAQAIIFGILGALLAEALKRWEQYGKLPKAKFNALFTDLRAWLALAILALLGGLFGYFTLERNPKTTMDVCFFAGVGGMSVVRNFLSAAVHNREVTLGSSVNDSLSLRDILT